jgi:diadenosine tetraphosphate (Ap4A) HIT family hydrolase
MIFSDAAEFRRKFRAGLNKLLQAPTVTPSRLVLVAANAIVLRDTSLLDQALAAARPLLAAPASGEPNEDLDVLRHIVRAADPFNLIHRRTTAAGWLLEFNELRALRPRREAAAAVTTIHHSFDATKFNFTRIPVESYWSGKWQHQNVAFYFNKYPIAPYHTSIVPAPGAGHPQYLTAQAHQLAWDLRAQLAETQPGLVIAYNALGAYASVNHLHFQMIPEGAHLPLLHAPAGHYPVPFTSHGTAGEAWDHIHGLQAHDQPFNLIYAADRAIVIPRQFQGTYDQPAWNTGFAWYELAGALIITDEHAFQTLTDPQIKAALAKVKLD